MLSCLVGARLILIVQIICCTRIANDSLMYFLLSFILSTSYWEAWVALNPDESIPTNSCPIFVRIVNDEITFSGSGSTDLNESSPYGAVLVPTFFHLPKDLCHILLHSLINQLVVV